VVEGLVGLGFTGSMSDVLGFVMLGPDGVQLMDFAGCFSIIVEIKNLNAF